MMALSILLVILAGIFKAVMDTLKSHYGESVFCLFPKYAYWLDESIAWKNKYKNGIKSNGEKFWGSSTIFVFITSGWHFSQKLFLTCYALSFAFYPYSDYFILQFAGLYVLQCLVFELFYGCIFTRMFN